MREEYRKIVSGINKNKIVSFDVFDTLLIRGCTNPTDIFYYIETNYAFPGYAKRRIVAEKKARKNLKEVTLRDIYEQDEELVPFLEIEKLTEKENIRLNSEIYELYQYALKNAKSVIITTDIYFDKQFMIDLLYENGVKGFADIFVSCEYRATKKEGELFDILMSSLEIGKDDLIHIGDNPISDCQSPQKRSIKSFCIKKCEDIFLNHYDYRIKNTNTWTGSVFVKLCAIRNRMDYDNYWHKLGFELMGPVCFGYSSWIKKKIEELNAKDISVCFVARDGYLLKKTFEYLWGGANETKYVYAPRNVNSAFEKKELSDEEVREYRQYLESLNLSDTIVIIDSRTQSFSSQKLFTKFLNTRIIGLYYINSVDNPELEYYSYHPDRNNPILSWNMMEYFLSAPTPSILKVIKGEPVYAESDIVEQQRQKAFHDVEKGVLEFAEWAKKWHVSEDIPEKVITDWVNNFLMHPCAEDKVAFKEVKFANDALSQNYVNLNPFFEKPKSIGEYKETLLRKLVLHPRVYGIARQIYRKLRR